MTGPRWTCGGTKTDNIRNERVRGSIKVASMAKKIREKRLECNTVRRREEGHVLRRMAGAPVPGKGLRGRQKTCWKQKANDTMDRTKRKREPQTLPAA